MHIYADVLAFVWYYLRLSAEFLVFLVISWRFGPKTKYVMWDRYVSATWQNFDQLRQKVRLLTKRIDPRDMEIIPKENRVRCKHCNIITNSKYPAVCMLCGEHIFLDKGRLPGGLKIMYKYGSRVFGATEIRKAEDANRGQGGIDLLQPTRNYDKSTKQWITNPAYVKHYGDPFAGDSETH